MKAAIQEIATQAHYYETEAAHLRRSGDHIKATRLEKLAKNLRKIAKMAALIFLP
jgi:prefoldin subunit 5